MAPISCQKSGARQRLAQDKAFIEMLKREHERQIGEDYFYENSLLKSPYPEVRKWSAISLGRIGSDRALGLLYKAVQTGEAAVRAASAFAIGEIADRTSPGREHLPRNSEAMAHLSRLLNDPSITVRMRAMEAIGKVGSYPDGYNILRQLKSCRFGVYSFERACLESSIAALVRLGRPAARSFIEKLADSYEPEIRKQALDTVRRFDPNTGLTNEGLAVASLHGRSGAEAIRPAIYPITETFIRVLASKRKYRTIARLETNHGNIEIELFREDAAVTVAHFVLMAEGGHYDGMRFVAARTPSLTEAAGSGARARRTRMVTGEVNMRPFKRGRVGMAHSGGNSVIESFFITLEPKKLLDGVNTCFGRVISGMQVVDRIVPGDQIRRVVINETVSFHDYQEY